MTTTVWIVVYGNAAVNWCPHMAATRSGVIEMHEQFMGVPWAHCRKQGHRAVKATLTWASPPAPEGER